MTPAETRWCDLHHMRWADPKHFATITCERHVTQKPIVKPPVPGRQETP